MLEGKKKYKILIVDDSRFNRLVMTSMLAKDYLLEEANDGKEAMSILQERVEEFSLVLLDIVMPNMGGFDLLKIMKKCGWLEFLPVIMISSDYTPENIELSYQLGASDLIQRPYNEKVIRHRIANTIALSSKQRELSSALVDEVIQENENSAAMVSVLSHIVETRNGESGNHVQNIRNLTGLLLEELMQVTDRYSFSKKEMLLICNASSLHDIGKITIPEEILNKPGKFTDEEFRVMKGHAMAGASMVEPLLLKENVNPLIKLTYEICRWHHERYDGRGYPDGLKGDEIPITAQVVSVADVYDALTSERCYKPAYPPKQALQMILDGQCGVFNPLLMECLSRIFNKYKDTMVVSDAEAMSENNIASSQELIEDVITHLHDSGLAFSDKIVQTLMHERLRSKFFFNDIHPAFYYTVSPPLLHYNKAGMKLFGVDAPIVDLEHEGDPHEKYDRRAADRLRQKLAATTNEQPLFKEEVLLSLPGESPQRYQCVIQTIWDSANAPHYSEVVGRLIPLDGEAVQSLASEELESSSIVSGSMTGREAFYLISTLKFMVHNVRLVDPTTSTIVELNSSGELIRSGHVCYHIWKQEHRCANCTSMKCLAFQTEFSKIVFLDNEAFHVISQYIKVDGTALVLEMLTRITDDTLFDGSGRRLSSSSISDLNTKLYLDPLTNVYNRRYYNERISETKPICALAIVNVDHFKDINDAYGRAVGDTVLVRVAAAIGGEVRAPNALIRYGGDEFVVMFESIDPDLFEAALEKMRSDIAALSIEGMEDGRHVTVSIGGAAGPDLPAMLMAKADKMLHKAKETTDLVELWEEEELQQA